MAQVYSFTDANGTVRLMAEIDPAPAGSQTLIAGTPVVLNNAAILSLPTTTLPEIIPAPGANKIAIPTLVVVRTDFSVAYSGIDADGSDLSFYWDDGNSSVQWANAIANADDSGGHVIADLTTLLTQTSPANVLLTPAKEAKLQPPTSVSPTFRQPNNDESVMVDTHMILYVTNGADFGGGDPANTMTIVPYYVVLGV